MTRAAVSLSLLLRCLLGEARIFPLPHEYAEKRYRSMQEHIRRAHPEHYISKLPATEESFLLMINTPPSERPPIQPNSSSVPQGSSLSTHGYPPMVDHPQAFNHDRHMYDNSNPGTPRTVDDHAVGGSLLPAASAAAALAQLHGHKIEPEWDSEATMGKDGKTSSMLPTKLPQPPATSMKTERL
ncbi:hypothetical protein C8034_v010493 [Colletotrichum sidae]|uniref:Uncharacterized protein n=1 Tax=Colletotrichum sidae TaxID=1347389 RepID=A0A4R8TLE2_9PEZI|nr:hypothetical protein C8034_v010493 [Colletotrichum sidae]